MKSLYYLMLFVCPFAGAQTILTACQPITAPGSYVLGNDVVCGAQGFAIATANVTVDLACHAIIYSSVPAFSACDTWYKGLPAAACQGSHHDNFHLTSSWGCKGAIWQSPNSPPFTPAIGMGQSNGLAPGEIDNVIVMVQQPGAVHFSCSYCLSGWKIHDNEFISTVINAQKAGQTPLSARSAFQGVSVQFQGGLNQPGPGNLISRNIFVGYPQGAIYDIDQNSVHSDNVMLPTSRYANDYADVLTADNQVSKGNVVVGVGALLGGRGFDIEGSNETLANNFVMVQSLPVTLADQGTAPPGCEESGGVPMRWKSYPMKPPSQGNTISGNFVVGKAGPCSTNALRLTNLGPADNGSISGNTFMTIPGSAPDYPLSIEGDRAPIVWSGNTFTGSSIFVDWDGVAASIDAGQKWNLTGPTIFDSDGHTFAPESLTILDPIPSPTYVCSAQSSATLNVGQFQKICP